LAYKAQTCENERKYRFAESKVSCNVMQK